MKLLFLGDMTQWMMTTYFQAAGELYGTDIQRHVISSSYSAYPYTVAWFNRAIPDDPVLLLYGNWDGINRVIYSMFRHWTIALVFKQG
jgi:hypothetical protein